MTNEPVPARGRVCVYCGEDIPKGKRKDAQFCSTYCRRFVAQVRFREENREGFNAIHRRNRASRPEAHANVKRRSRLADVRKNMLSAAKSRAKTQHLPFNLTLEDLGPLPEYCPVLGIPLEIGSGIHCDGSPSLDKIIPKLGYVRGNVLIVSMRANRLKSDATVTELRQMAEFYEAHIKTSWMKGTANG